MMRQLNRLLRPRYLAEFHLRLDRAIEADIAEHKPTEVAALTMPAVFPDDIDTWLIPLAVGQPLVTVPLGLRGAGVVALDLEQTYTWAREDSGL
jgi:hypothetical protein